MFLADHGAEVTLVSTMEQFQGTSGYIPPRLNPMCRGKKSIVIDLKNASHRPIFEALLSSAQVLIDPNRPQVLAKLGYP